MTYGGNYYESVSYTHLPSKSKITKTTVMNKVHGIADVIPFQTPETKKKGSIIFFVGLTLPRYRFSKPSASLDMNLR